MNRRPEFDALRGLMLVLMTLTHMPTRFSHDAGQPLGFVSAAEGFVVLSAFMAGWVYSELGRRRGMRAMWRAFELRALKIYLCQAALLLFLFTVIARLGIKVQQPAVTNLISFYLDDPWLALRAALVMFYNPPLLDILPMYVLYMLLSPFVLAHALRRGWGGWLIGSLLLWFIAQYGLSHALYDAIRVSIGLKVPLSQVGAFDPFAWQFVWVFGLCLGAGGMSLPNGETRAERWLLGFALIVAGTGFVWRHVQGQTPFLVWHQFNVLFDKWRLGPLRLLDFFALVLLLRRFGPALLALKPRWPLLETLGAASLPVFCAHLVLVLLALALFGESRPDRPVWIDVALLTFVFAALYAVALVSRWFDRRRAARRRAEQALPPAGPASGSAAR